MAGGHTNTLTGTLHIRDHGGQILFVEFCDWAIKKHLLTDDDGRETGSIAAGGEGYRPVEEMLPGSMAHASEKRKATAAAPGQRAPAAASSHAAVASRPVESGAGTRCGLLRACGVGWRWA